MFTGLVLSVLPDNKSMKRPLRKLGPLLRHGLGGFIYQFVRFIKWFINDYRPSKHRANPTAYPRSLE